MLWLRTRIASKLFFCYSLVNVVCVVNELFLIFFLIRLIYSPVPAISYLIPTPLHTNNMYDLVIMAFFPAAVNVMRRGWCNSWIRIFLVVNFPLIYLTIYVFMHTYHAVRNQFVTALWKTHCFWPSDHVLLVVSSLFRMLKDNWEKLKCYLRFLCCWK